MRYYKCTVLVAVPDKVFGEDFDGGDEGFLLQDLVNDSGGYNPNSVIYKKSAVHLGTSDDISAKEFKKLRKAQCWPEGGV